MKRNKAPVFTDYLTAGEACEILSKRLGHNVSNRHLSQLTKRKKNPLRALRIGTRLLYHKADVEAASIRQRSDNAEISN